MSSYLPESRTFEVGNILYSPAAYTSSSQTKAGKGLLDTIDSKQSEYTRNKQQTQNAQIVGERATLPPPQPKAPQNELMILAEAFVAASNAMHNSVLIQTNDYTQLQQLDQTQTQAVLQSTTNALNNEQAAESLAAQVNNYKQTMNNDSNIFGWVMFALGIVLMVATIASAFFDGGASLAALPEEEGAFEMGDLATDATEDTLSDSDTDEVSLDPASDSDSEVDDCSSSDEGMSDIGDSESSDVEDENSDQVSKENEEQTQKDLDKSDAENAKSKESWAKRLGKIAGKTFIAAVFASPMLMKGIVGLKVSDKLKEVAAAQEVVGESVALLQRNNMYFQFLQQLVQREGGVLQEEANDASEVVETYSSITSAYRGIAYGLANSV